MGGAALAVVLRDRRRNLDCQSGTATMARLAKSGYFNAGIKCPPS